MGRTMQHREFTMRHTREERKKVSDVFTTLGGMLKVMGVEVEVGGGEGIRDANKYAKARSWSNFQVTINRPSKQTRKSLP